MTNHDDQHDIEVRLRAALRERAGDVDVTPALYERVQQEAARGVWLRRGLAVAAVAAVVVGAFAVVPALLPDPAPFDVVDTPEDSLPGGDAESPDTALPGAGGLTAALLDRDLAHAADDGAGGSVLYVRDRVVRSAQQVVSLAAGRAGTAGTVVAVRADGSIGVVARDGTGDQFDAIVDAAPNGGRAVVTPTGDGVAWIEGRDLHVMPLPADPAGERVLPLEGDVPGDLRIEQWFSQADAQVILASAPGGGLWSIPMDDSNVVDTAPTTPAFVLAEDALDGALLDDLRRVELVRDPTGAELRVRVAGGEDGSAFGLVATGTDVELSTDGQRVVVHERDAGIGEVLETADGAVSAGGFSWEDARITAVTPLGDGSDDATDGTPEVTAVGTSLLVTEADGTTTELPVLEGAEVEATLGLAAARPGGTRDAFVVAYENQAEGESSIRFAQVVDDTVVRADAVVVVGQTGQQLTRLTWSPDGQGLTWVADDGSSGTVAVTVDEAADGSVVVETATDEAPTD